jgi:CRISPR-associated protein Cas6
MFSVSGDKITADHGYYLHSALSDLLPFHHDEKQRGNTGVHPISGTLCCERMLAINSGSKLILRIAADRVADYLELCGKRLNIGNHSISVGIPSSRKLIPAVPLWSRLVTIKGFTTPTEFLDAAHRQLHELDIGARAHLVTRRSPVSTERRTDNIARSPFIKRTLDIKGRNVVGFSLVVTELTAEESLRLQTQGIGGRRSMGCGIFVPLR